MKKSIIVFFLIPLFTIPVFGQVILSTNELLNNAFDLNKEGKYEDSISILDGVIESEPDNTIALYYRSSAHIGLEQFQDAKDDLDRIYALKPEPSGGVHYNYGVALFGLEEYEEAIEYFELIDEKDHNYINALNKKGIALLNLSRSEEAVDSFDLVIENDPDNVTAHLFRGVSLSNMREYDEALKSINTALSLDPQNERANHALQTALNNKGLSLFYDDSNPEKAIIFFKQALANNPQDPNAAAYLRMAESKVSEERAWEIADSVILAWVAVGGGFLFSFYLYRRSKKQIQKLEEKLSHGN